ncbi:MAG TPA: phytanoyl-CoA dioxygenase family protein [Oligoflexia bacterium]|nr:phytanoyl-CoA dioxygenase family protein [Oligoflexia bacterium]HMP27947.1 phytanoyl-CoA dioxygenase family protein [Oligoflexia bacterium]
MIFENSRHPKILGAVYNILNIGLPPEKTRPYADHLICQLHPKYAGDGVDFAWHQDVKHRRSWDSEWSDINGNGSFVQTLMAIDQITKDNGPILIAPFDKEKHGKDLELPYKFNHPDLSMYFDLNKVTTLEMSPGDIVFINPYLIHGSYPNNSPGTTRYLLVNGYAAVGANHRLYPGRGSCARVDLTNGNVTNDHLSQLRECKIELFGSI